jgi:hypothetical protein
MSFLAIPLTPESAWRNSTSAQSLGRTGGGIHAVCIQVDELSFDERVECSQYR